MKELARCPWCLKDDTYKNYHDTLWGFPEHDDQKLLAKLILDGAQAGLSWYTILIRTESYAKAFDNWDAKKIAAYGPKDVDRLLNDPPSPGGRPGIIRNKAKVASAIQNAQAYLRIMENGKGSFDHFLWKHIDHNPIVNRWTDMKQVPASTPISDALSKDLKKAGFSFVGTTIVYAFMQAVGMVDDHLVTCWRRSSR